MEYQIMKGQLQKLFISTLTYVNNKTDVDKTDVKSEKN